MFRERWVTSERLLIIFSGDFSTFHSLCSYTPKFSHFSLLIDFHREIFTSPKHFAHLITFLCTIRQLIWLDLVFLIIFVKADLTRAFDKLFLNFVMGQNCELVKILKTGSSKAVKIFRRFLIYFLTKFCYSWVPWSFVYSSVHQTIVIMMFRLLTTWKKFSNKIPAVNFLYNYISFISLPTH